MSPPSPPRGGSSFAPLVIQDQGSLPPGGVVVSSPGEYRMGKSGSGGQTMHGDHAYVFYQQPVEPRALPIAFLHGHLQFSKTWGTTPDGREGFQTLFLRRRYGVYVIDQPRRGNAGQSTVPMQMTATPDDQFWFNAFRIGVWPEYFPGVQFAQDKDTLNQHFRQSAPNTGPFDLAVASSAVAALFDRIGPGILVSHSQGGGVGWAAAVRSANIRAIVSYEPGSNFPFPAGELPPSLPSSAGPLDPIAASDEDFARLTRIPIVIYYGDNIPMEPCDNPGQDQWRVRIVMARRWAEAVNRRGGDVTVVHLPDIGVTGNTHFPFSDLNSIEIADLMSEFLARKGLDR